MTSLAYRLKHEIVENKQRGTVDYFCSLLKTDDYFGICGAMAELEDRGIAELIETETSYAGNGLPVIQGVYGMTPEAIADSVVKSIKKFDREYVKSHGNSWKKLGFDPKKMKESNETVREMIVSKVREARQRN